MAASKENIELIRTYRKDAKFHAQYREGMRTLLDDHGLSVLEAELLFAVVHEPEKNTVSQLCAAIGKTKGVVSRGCEHLCRERYFRSEPDEKDLRVIHFYTAKMARVLIPVLTRYVETMEYVRKEREKKYTEDVFFCGRLDRRKDQLFPIHEKEPHEEVFPFLPYVSYSSFLENFCKKLREEDRNDFLERFSRKGSLACLKMGDREVNAEYDDEKGKGVYTISVKTLPVKDAFIFTVHHRF